MHTNKGQRVIRSKENLKDLYPLSPMQEGMLFHSLYDEGLGTFIEQVSYSITGDFNIKIFQQSWQEILKQHDILRTIFIFKKVPQPLQMVLKECEMEFDILDIQHLNNEQQKKFIENYQQNDRQRGFRLDQDILIRVVVFQLQQKKYEVLWTHHHILMDGWSSNLVIGQLIEIYKALFDGRKLNYSDAPSYGSFVKWLKQQDPEAAKHYWKQYLKDYNSSVEIPKSQFPEAGYKTSEFSFKLDEQATNQLEQLARKLKITFSNLLQGIWSILLAKYHDINDIVFGLTVSGRPPEIEGIEKIVGLFINTTPVRVSVEPHLTFIQLIENIHNKSIASKEYTYYPLANIQAESTQKSQLINHLFVFQNFPSHEETRGKLDTTPYGFEIEDVKVVEQINYDLAVVVTPGKHLNFRFLYNTKAFSEASLQRIENHLKNIIQAAIAKPDITINDINIIGDTEIRQLVSEFNTQDITTQAQQTIVDLIEQQANKTPNATAVYFADKTLSYQELNTNSERIAAFLHKKVGVQPGGLIGILLQPSEYVIVAILAVMKTGCGFLGLDPQASIKHNQAILQEYNIQTVLTDIPFTTKLTDFSGHVLVLENLQEEQNTNPELLSTNAYQPKPEDIAYIITKTNSTGQLEGIAVNHQSLLNYILWSSSFYFQERNIGNMPLFTAINLNISITSLFCPLVRGKAVVIIDSKEPSEALSQVFNLGSLIDGVRLTLSHISNLSELGIKQTTIHLAIASSENGEQLKKEHVASLLGLNKCIEIYNEYGSVETTAGCIATQVTAPNQMTIGKPIHNTRVYILNKQLQLVPIGCAGEIYIAGSCLASGYWNNPEKTATKFINHSLEPASQLYRTGDLGKWLESGEIVYLGQIKTATGVSDVRKKPPQTQSQAYKSPNTSIEAALVNIWQNVLGIPKVGVYDDFFNLGGHSMNVLSVISQVHKALGVEIPVKAIYDFPTIQGLSDYISAVESYQSRFGQHHMTLLNSEYERCIFALPTLFGYGLTFKGLAQNLNFHSVYALDFIEEVENPLTYYVDLLRATQPQGSYTLIGYCIGGNLAFELTKQLECLGHQVSDIIMLDSVPRSSKYFQTDEAIQAQIEAELTYYSEQVRDDADLFSILNNPYFRTKIKTRTSAYISYFNDQVNQGLVKANIHLIRSADTQSKPNDTEHWVTLTTGNVFYYDGSGKHGDMFAREHLQHNSVLVKEILERICHQQEV